jgi:AcrR family transcriptional regulator
MGGKILENKRLKMAKLYDAAYELFTSNGVHNTVIDDIVKNAGVAKGTFYLYCKDKYDLVDKVILRKTSALLNGAMESLKKQQENSPEPFSMQQNVLLVVDFLSGYFVKDPKFLELIFKNLSLPLFEKLIYSDEMKTAWEGFTKQFMRNGGSTEAAGQRLYIIVSMVGSVLYNCIVLKGPYQFEEIKPELYRSVEQILV